MAQIKRERLANCYCPACGHEMTWFGSKKFKMVRCIMKECNNTIPFEKAVIPSVDDVVEGEFLDEIEV